MMGPLQHTRKTQMKFVANGFSLGSEQGLKISLCVNVSNKQRYEYFLITFSTN